jgi:hypothetical protein
MSLNESHLEYWRPHPISSDSYSRLPITYLMAFAPRQILKVFSLQTNSLVGAPPHPLNRYLLSAGSCLSWDSSAFQR